MIRPKFFDFVFFFVSLTLLVLSLFALRTDKLAESYLIVDSPYGEYVYPLSVDSVYDIEGVIGYSSIQVKNRRASFLDSPCPNKTCVQSQSIGRNGEWSACLPNKIFIRIESKTSDMDAVAF